jgi:TetR/AcrR family transcriptional regulator, regulator of cefoperazone and chloramphenicol sensitivity
VPKPHQTGSYQRGEEARRRLLEAAIEAFALQGYEAASTRTITEKAGVNLAAIPYYFGSKEGLYQAVAEHIATHINGPELTATLERVEATLANSQLTRDQALALLHELFDGFVTALLCAEGSELWAKFVFRELMEPSSVFEILNQQVVQKTIRPCAGLIARMLGRPNDDPECLVRAFALYGQVLIFRTVREVTLETLGWETFSGDRLEVVRTVIQHQVKGALENSLTAAPGATSSKKSHPTA